MARYRVNKNLYNKHLVVQITIGEHTGEYLKKKLKKKIEKVKVINEMKIDVKNFLLFIN